MFLSKNFWLNVLRRILSEGLKTGLSLIADGPHTCCFSAIKILTISLDFKLFRAAGFFIWSLRPEPTHLVSLSTGLDFLNV